MSTYAKTYNERYLNGNYYQKNYPTFPMFKGIIR